MEENNFNNPKKINSYRDLVVWQKAMELAEMIYILTEIFPKTEIYGLTSQIRRAVVSIASNIAEGSARKSTADFMRFLKIANGSLVEVETQIILASKLKYINEEDTNKILSICETIGKMILGLHNSLKSKL